jgi:hypothetical protein
VSSSHLPGWCLYELRVIAGDPACESVGAFSNSSLLNLAP